MRAHIRRLESADVDAVVALSLRAWEPVFASLEAVLGRRLFGHMYPNGDWRPSQERDVRRSCAEHQAWVADAGGTVVGFVTVDLRPGDHEGEIYMLAVDPSSQRRGIGSRLTEWAAQAIADAGKALVIVETGGDPGHAAARRTYESAGFTPLPIVRYFKLS